MPLPGSHERLAVDLVDAVRTGTSVALVGLPGSGRTAALQRAADLLGDDGYRVLDVRGAAALRDRPLEALAVSDLGAARPARGASLLATYVTALERQVERGSVVLVVDDVDDLDDDSVGALVAAWGRRPYPVLATSRPTLLAAHGRGLADAVTPIDRIDLPALSYEESTQLVEDLLGGPLLAETAGRIHARAGGLPGLASGIARTARRAGRLVRVDGVWHARGELWSPALSATVERLTAGIDDDALHAAQVLALAGPVTTTVARRIVPWPTLEALDGHGLLRTMHQGDRELVVLFPPLVAEQFQHAGRSTLRLRVTQEIARALSDDVPEELSASVVGADQVRAGVEVSTSQGSESHTLRNRLIAEHVLRRRAVRRAEWEHDRTADTAVPYLATLLVQGGAGAVEVIGGTRETGEPVSVAMLRGLAAVRCAVAEGDVAAGHRVLRAPLPPDLAHVPGLRGLLDALDGRLSLVVEGVQDDAAEDPPSTPGAHDSEPSSVAALRDEVRGVLRAERLVTRGRAVDALAVLDTTGATGAWDRPREAALGMAKVLAGRPGEALVEADRRLDVALDDLDLDGVWVHGYTRALALATLGRFTELRDHVGAVMSVGIIPLRQFHHAVGNLALGAYAALQQGATDSALLLARQARDVTTVPGPWPMMSAGWIEPVVAARALGDPQAEADAYWAEARMLTGRGYVAAAGIAGILALGAFPDPGRARQLESSLPTGQGDGTEDLAALARASAAADPEPALDLYRDGLRRGALLVAGRALGHAVRVLRTAGNSTEADRLVAEASCRLPDDLRSALVPAVDLGSLTTRELDVVRLVEAGASNQQVAHRLGITVSTVENHLNRVYRKLDVDGRHGLVALLRDRSAV